MTTSDREGEGDLPRSFALEMPAFAARQKAASKRVAAAALKGQNTRLREALNLSREIPGVQLKMSAFSAKTDSVWARALVTTKFNQDIANQFLERASRARTVQLQLKLANPALNSAMRHVMDQARIQTALSQEALSALAELIETGEVEDELLDDDGFEADLQAAIDRAAELLAEANPVLTRSTARAVVVLFVRLMWLAALAGLSVLGPPAVAAGTVAGSSLSVGQVGKSAGGLFDRLFPEFVRMEDVPEDPEDPIGDER